MKDSPLAHEFSSLWNDLWRMSCRKRIFVDQPGLNEANYRMNYFIRCLPDEYNAQIGRCLNYFASAKIIHYFATWNAGESFYLLAKDSFLKKIKKNGLGDCEKKIVCNPKKAFDRNTYILNYKMTKYIFSPNGNMLLNACQSEKNAEKRLHCILMGVAKIYYKIIPFLHPIYRMLKK
jgi:hypothetical protein